MSTKYFFCTYFILLLIFTTTICSSNKDDTPNVIILIANDLGYSDLSCFGNDLIRTINIDKLAENGVKFNRMYSMPSDAGSMAAIMTGRQPLRMGLIKGIFGWPTFWSVAQSGGLPRWEMNIAKFYNMKGNTAILFGRWDLGSWFSSLPTNQGFGGFYGTVIAHNPGCSSDLEDRLTDSTYFWMLLSDYVPIFISFCVLIFTSKMLSFISFRSVIVLIIIMFTIMLIVRVYCFLLPLNSDTCQVLENSIVREHAYNDSNLTLKTTEKAIHYLKFRRKFPFLLIVSYHQPGYPAFASKQFKGKSGINKYYDSILEFDWSVGEITKTLSQLGLENDTIIILLSDNGPVLTHPYTGSPLKHRSIMKTLRGEKFSLQEGGLRVPAIISWPNNFLSNKETDVVTSLMDIFPTIMDIRGGTTEMYNSHMKTFDGKSLIPILKNPKRPSDFIHKVLLHYCQTGEVSAATVGDYKVYFISHNKTNDCSGTRLEVPLVYNIVEDPGEINPLQAKYHVDIISRARSTAVRFEMSLEIPSRDIISQFDQIPLPWHMWITNVHISDSK